MPRVLLLILLLSACARRELATGDWTGVARPDAAAPTSAPPGDQGSPVTKNADAASTAPGDASAAGGGFAPSDASAAPRGPDMPPVVNDPVAPHADGSADVGDARSCPESGQCD